ncbi:hypothetical protein N665_1671s0007 [Sinapis alba]|nr:hypothetical protein N665_1671s0007 [Sinapis alba]
MASSTQDEEVLNNDTKHEDDDKIMSSESSTNEADMKIMEQEIRDANQEDSDKIVSAESSTNEAADTKIMEQEAKDANQEDDDKIVASESATTTTTSPRSLTQEEEKAREDDAREVSRILVSMSHDLVRPWLKIDEDDSEETLRFLSRWKAPETPPEKIIHRSLVGQCSRPIQKQLTTSEVEQNRLSLSKSQVRKKFQQILDGSGRKETRFTVYGPDGKVHEIWLGEKKSSFDLTTGWWTFVEEYGLKECCDFVTVWMFRHRITQRICLAIDATRFAFRKEVSQRISKAAFEDSD